MLLYHPLDVEKNDIRLLELTKPISPESKDELVACNLRHVSLDDYTDEYAKFQETYKGTRSNIALDLLWVINSGLHDITPLIATAHQGSLLEDIPVELLERSAALPYSNNIPSRYNWGDFTALSYVWGDPKRTSEIIVNGEKISVTENLELALRGISGWWFDDDDTNNPVGSYIWVDALCINQSDLSERSAQLKRMGDVYRGAVFVSVWAGASPDTGKELSKLLEQIGDEINENGLTDEPFLSRLNLENAKGWQGVLDLSLRPYWRRLWIIQEVLLANTGAFICYGDQKSSLNLYFAAMAYLTKSIDKWDDMWPVGSEGDDSETSSQPLFNERGVIDLEHLIQLNSYKSFNRPRPDLMHLLHGASRAEQTDARDKVYGILGLVDPALSDVLVTDYEKPVTQIFQEFAVAVIQVTGKLDIIYQRRVDMESDSYLPSWVPDWSSTLKSEQNIAKGEGNSDFFAPYHMSRFRAAENTVHVFREAEDLSSLLCRGFQFDSIDGLSCRTQAHLPHDEHEIFSRKSASPSQKVHNTITDIRNMFWDTLLLGNYEQFEPEGLSKLQHIPLLIAEFDNYDHESEGEDDEYIDKVLARFQQCNKDFNICGHSLSSCFDERTDSDEQNASLDYLNTSFDGLLGFLQTNILWRRLATTEKDYLVLAPRATQQGDEIYILKGCNVPLVLRHNDDGSHTLVGECYIQGLMNGEALEFQQKSGVEDVDVILR